MGSARRGFAIVAAPETNKPPAKSGKFCVPIGARLLPPSSSAGDALFLLGGGGPPRTTAEVRAAVMAASVLPARVALVHELHRCELAARSYAQLVGVLTEAFSGTSLDTTKAAVGLYPALVFETLASAEAASSSSSSSSGEEAERRLRDPALPDPTLLPNGVSTSVLKRVTTLLHDHRRHTSSTEVLAAAALTIAQRISRIAVDALADMERFTATSTEALPPSVKIVEGEDSVELTCGATTHEILPGHFSKLRQLYDLHSPEIAVSEGNAGVDFAFRVFTLLHRYYGLTGALRNPGAEGGWHGSLPYQCFESLVSTGSVAAELFASPLNCALTTFCSAFPDTDAPFGSLGSFFAIQPVQGVFEANPPFDHSVALRMANHMAASLQHAARLERPLMYVVILPCADKGKPLASMRPALDALKRGPFVSAEATLCAKEVVYIDGNQQCAENTAFTARLDTLVVALQSATPGSSLLKPALASSVVLAALCEAWRAAFNLSSDSKKRARDE